MAVIAILGAGTGVGKTHIAQQLLRALAKAGSPALAFKPLESGTDLFDGVPSDADALRIASGLPLTLQDVCPWPLPRPVAPAEEVERLGVSLTLDDVEAAADRLLNKHPQTPLLFEGAGGVLSPLTWEFDALDVAARLNAGLWLVVRDELGAISSIRCAYEAAVARDLPVLGVIVNRFPDEQSVALGKNVAALRRLGIADAWAQEAESLAPEVLERTMQWIRDGEAHVSRR